MLTVLLVVGQSDRDQFKIPAHYRHDTQTIIHRKLLRVLQCQRFSHLQIGMHIRQSYWCTDACPQMRFTAVHCAVTGPVTTAKIYVSALFKCSSFFF